MGNFTEYVHIKGNFCPTTDRVGCFNDNSYKILLAYRALALHYLNISDQNVVAAYNDLNEEFLQNFKTEIYDFNVSRHHIHLWITGGKNRYNSSEKMKFLIYEIEKTRPVTFNMNDVWHNDLKIYNMQLKYLLEFFEKYFHDVGNIDIVET